MEHDSLSTPLAFILPRWGGHPQSCPPRPRLIRMTGRSGTERGFQIAIVRAHSGACALSVMPGNRRRSSTAAHVVRATSPRIHHEVGAALRAMELQLDQRHSRAPTRCRKAPAAGM